MAEPSFDEIERAQQLLAQVVERYGPVYQPILERLATELANRRPKGWIEPRLLTKTQARDYLGLSEATFNRECDVPPNDLGGQSKPRWDRHKLDAWIDQRTSPDAHRSKEYWLAKLDESL